MYVMSYKKYEIIELYFQGTIIDKSAINHQSSIEI